MVTQKRVTMPPGLRGTTVTDHYGQTPKMLAAPQAGMIQSRQTASLGLHH